MCDIAVALPDSTRNGAVLFAKNSDRPAGESQVLIHSPERRPEAGDSVACSYRRVPDSPALATVGTRPYWSWGYETGISEAGVVGGNTAVFTRPLRQKTDHREPGLTGLELLRFGLERGSSAQKAVLVITDLLEKYGQWGSAVPGASHEKGSYDNAFLLADSREAWVLETAGRNWVAQRVTGGTRSLSNQLTIRSRGDLASEALVETARNQRWWKGADAEFDFALAYSDHENYARQVSHLRWRRSASIQEAGAPDLEVTSMMTLLRDHFEGTFIGGPQFSPYLPDFQTLCMHDSPAGFTWGNTATSMVVELDPSGVGDPKCWIAYLPPCSSLFLPFLPFREELPEALGRVGTAGLQVAQPPTVASDRPSSDSLWWRLHKLVEAAARRPLRRRDIRSLFDPIEDRLLGQLDRNPAGLPEWAVVEMTAAIAELESKWATASDVAVS